MSQSGETAPSAVGADELVLVRSADGVMEISLNRPEKKNALTQAMYVRLVDALESAEADDAIRAILLTGYNPETVAERAHALGSAEAADAPAPPSNAAAQPRSAAVFTAGNDIADFLSNFSLEEGSPVFRFLFGLVRASKPIVAAVNGVAVGVGTTMLLHCDLVYAGTGARFQLPFINLALVPEAGSTLLLPRLAGQQRAAELLMLGEPFDAQTAIEIGLVNRVFSEAEVLQRARAAAHALASKAPGALQQTKQLLRAPILAQLEEVMRIEARAFAAGLQSPEAEAALMAFLARRK